MDVSVVYIDFREKPDSIKYIGPETPGDKVVFANASPERSCLVKFKEGTVTFAEAQISVEPNRTVCLDVKKNESFTCEISDERSGPITVTIP